MQRFYRKSEIWMKNKDGMGWNLNNSNPPLFMGMHSKTPIDAKTLCIMYFS